MMSKSSDPGRCNKREAPLPERLSCGMVDPYAPGSHFARLDEVSPFFVLPAGGVHVFVEFHPGREDPNQQEASSQDKWQEPKY